MEVPVPVDFIGTLPGWITATGVISLLGLVLRNQFVHRKLTLDNQSSQVTHYAKECTTLREELREMGDRLHSCEAECAKRTRELEDELHDRTRDMQDELHGLRKQHVQEQISLINSIIESVDSPMLKTFLKTMESVQRSLPEIQTLGTEVADRNSDEGSKNA